MSNQRMRVLQLGSPTGLYGAERWILALVRYLDPAEVDSIISVIRDDPTLTAPLCHEAQATGFRTHVFEAYGRVNWSVISQLRRFLLSNSVQILHTHGYKTDIIGFLAVQGTRCKIVSTPHGWSKEAGFKLKIYEQIDRLFFPFFDAVVPLSPDLYAGLKKIQNFRSKLQLIQNGVDICEIDSVDKPSIELQALKAEGNILIGYIGQLIHRKGLDTLIRAFSLLEVEKKKLCIVGEGPLLNELEILAGELGVQNEVLFWGFRKDRIALLKGFDVFVLPSRQEGIPRCLMEAMAAGIPVIATDIPGCRDLVDTNTGMLFKMNDHVDLVYKITRVIGDNHLKNSLSLAGKLLIKNQYSAHIMAKKYSELYTALIKQKSQNDTQSGTAQVEE